MELFEIYQSMGLSRAVFDRGEAVLAGLADRFRQIDRTAELNQAKVLSAMQKNRVGANHFAATTGYGYDGWSGSTPTFFTPRPPWCGPRSPAAPMR